MAKAKRPRGRGKQLRIDGMEPLSILEIDEAAEAYHSVKLDLCDLTKQESEAKAALIETMKRHEVAFYTTPDGIKCTRTVGCDNVKTTRGEDDAEVE